MSDNLTPDKVAMTDDEEVVTAEQAAANATAEEAEKDPTDEGAEALGFDDEVYSDKVEGEEETAESGSESSGQNGGGEPSKNEEPQRRRRDVLNEQIRHNAEVRQNQLARDSFFAGWHSLESAMRNHTTRRGIVASADLISVPSGEGYDVPGVHLSVIAEGQFKVIIPFEDIYREFPIDMSTVVTTTATGRREFANRQLNMAKKFIGVGIDFMIMDMKFGDDPMSDYAIYGSRKAALERMERANYTSNRGAKPLISEGDIIDCEVISVGYHVVQVCAGGIDTKIRIPDLTHVYVPYAKSVYHPGDTVRVMVREIRVGADGRRSVVLDGRAVELLDALNRQGLISQDALVRGVITNVLPAREQPTASRMRPGAGPVRATAFLDHYNMPAIVKAFSPRSYSKALACGDEALLRVVGFNRYGYVVVTCEEILGPSPNNVHG